MGCVIVINAIITSLFSIYINSFKNMESKFLYKVTGKVTGTYYFSMERGKNMVKY